MRFLQRDEHGNVVGHFAHRHDYATEEVDDDHPDLIAWREERERRRTEALSPEQRLQDLERRVAALERGR